MEFFLVYILLFILLFFPGIFFIKLYYTNKINTVTSIFFTSLSFWILITYFISIFKLPLNITFYFLISFFILYFIFLNIKRNYNYIYLFNYKNYKLNLEHYILLFFLLIYFLPFLINTIPPGGDITMHAYITKLIINNNAIPTTFEPFLPYKSFGSYSSGYHIINALLTGFNEKNLLLSFKIMAVLSYPLCLLSIVLLFQNFFKTKFAIYGAIICFSVSASIQNCIGWGGNPSVLSFAFCVFSISILYNAAINKNKKLFLFSALPISVIPLIHLIPAAVFFYLIIFSYLIFIVYNKDKLGWILINSIFLFLLILFFLMPFLLNFKNENSIELSKMIWEWQQLMTQNKFTTSLIKNIFIAIDRLKTRIDNPIFILGIFSFIMLFIYKKYKQLLIISILIFLSYLLFLNCNYWILPLSELLYPERVAMYSIVCIGLFISLYLQTDEEYGKIYYFKKIKFKLSYLIIIIFMFIGIIEYSGRYFRHLAFGKIKMKKENIESFNWIKENTDKSAIIKTSYEDIGMWIPAFTDRATIGTHIHFIHEVAHIREKMEEINIKKYYYITLNDEKENKPILQNIKDKKIVFQNKEVKIYY